MEVIGNGVDIVENSRIKKLIKNIKFIKRIYSTHEIKKSIICKKNKLRNFKVFLSLSDEAKHSIAYVILSRSKK